MPEPKIVRERIVEALVTGDDGRILHNSFQQDDPVLVQDMDDGLRYITSTKTGMLIVKPFNPQTVERVRCPHCNGELGGGPDGKPAESA